MKPVFVAVIVVTVIIPISEEVDELFSDTDTIGGEENAFWNVTDTSTYLPAGTVPIDSVPPWIVSYFFILFPINVNKLDI